MEARNTKLPRNLQGGRYFPRKMVNPWVERTFASPGEAPKPRGPVEYEIPPPGFQSIAASATVRRQETIRAEVNEVYVDIPRRMTASLVADGDTLVSVSDNQGSTGIRRFARMYVNTVVVTLTNNKGTAQVAKFILKGD